MTTEPEPLSYLASISLELECQANRIRNLIGDSHWLTDGHHKEYLLNGVLERFLPNGFICGRGFVVRDGQLNSRSKEQDILIVDVRKSAPLFREHGVIVSFAENVVVAISVKSILDHSSLSDAVKGLNSIPMPAHKQIWRGVYAFSACNSWSKNPTLLSSCISKSRKGTSSYYSQIQHGSIAVANHSYTSIIQKDQISSYICYCAGSFATGLFVSNICDFVSCANANEGSRCIADLLSSTEFDTFG